MEALRDPYARVHPIFWPVLWLSLRAFVRWSARMVEAGHGFAGIAVEITWYGYVHVVAVDFSETGAAFRRHMMGAGEGDDWAVLARASRRVDELLISYSADPSEGWGPWIELATCARVPRRVPWIPAVAGICGNHGEGHSPPACPAPPLAWLAAGRVSSSISLAARPSPLRSHLLE